MKGDKTPCDSSSIASRLLPLLERLQLEPRNPFWLVFSCNATSSLVNPWNAGWSIRHIFPSPVTAPLSVPLPCSVKRGSVTVWKRAAAAVTADAVTHSRTVTGAGIPTGNAISSVTISTCMWLPIPTATFPSFHF